MVRVLCRHVLWVAEIVGLLLALIVLFWAWLGRNSELEDREDDEVS